MTAPGTRLQRLASRICSTKTMTRLIDPVIADLQFEYGEARRQKRTWRCRWLRLAGYIAFWQVCVFHLAGTAASAPIEWLGRDVRVVGRVLATSVLAASLVTALFVLPPLLQLSRYTGGRLVLPADASQLIALMLSLIPQALGIGLAIGLPCGVLIGLRGRMAGPRACAAVAGLVLAGALATWFTVNTLMPAGNQAFRERVWRQIGGQQIGAGATLNRGPNELSLSELSARIDAMRRAGARADSAVLLRSFYMRWVVSAAPLVLGLFAMFLCSQVKSSRTSLAIGLAVIAGYVALYVVISPAHYWPGADSFTPLANALVPNVALVLLAILLRLRSRHRPPDIDAGVPRSG